MPGHRWNSPVNLWRIDAVICIWSIFFNKQGNLIPLPSAAHNSNAMRWEVKNFYSRTEWNYLESKLHKSNGYISSMSLTILLLSCLGPQEGPVKSVSQSVSQNGKKHYMDVIHPPKVATRKHGGTGESHVAYLSSETIPRWLTLRCFQRDCKLY